MPTAVVGLMTGLLTHVFAMSGEKYVYKYNDVVVGPYATSVLHVNNTTTDLIYANGTTYEISDILNLLSSISRQLQISKSDHLHVINLLQNYRACNFYTNDPKDSMNISSARTYTTSFAMLHQILSLRGSLEINLCNAPSLSLASSFNI